MRKWKDIADAPHDGTVILARGHDFGDTTRKKHTALAYYENGVWNEVGTDGALLYYLKEWRPVADATAVEAGD